MTIKEFICPGEKHAISRSVHLARMAAYYPKCGDCPFRGETGQLAPVLSGRRAAGSRQHRRSLVAADGLRGIFINELGRGEAFALTAAFASLLWERRGRIGEDSGDSNFFARNSHEFRDQTRPTVVVGYDQRPSSPELMAGVLDGLRQTGCGIVDAGAATAPYLWWNVARSGATGGILITGAGCDPSWSGMDFVGPGSVPISSGEATQVGGRRSEVGGRKSEVRGRRSEVGNQRSENQSTIRNPQSAVSLEQIESRSRLPLNRPTRSTGEFRTVRNWSCYEESVASRFHALRPLRVVVGTGTSLLQRMSEGLFRRLPCELVPLTLPIRSRRMDQPDDPDVLRAAAAIRESGAHLGVLIDDDGQTCALLDETGRLVPATDAALVLSRQILEGEPAAAVISESDLPNPTRTEMFRAMQSSAAAFGGGAGGRFWFRDSAGPTCDAFLTLAAILSALSRSDAECSEVFAIHAGATNSNRLDAAAIPASSEERS